MYRLGNIHLRLEHVAAVFPVRPLLGQEGVHGFDVMIGGYLHTAKYVDVEDARRAHAALLRAIDPPAPVIEPAPAPVQPEAPAPQPRVVRKTATRRSKSEPPPRSRH
jgi:hypothetical protein